MAKPQLHVVTGAFGYSGRYIARRLLDAGLRVRTLTNSPNRPDPFGGRVEVRPLDFARPDSLAASLEGAEVLYNTYWVRFSTRDCTHEQAMRNTMALFDAAKRAGVKRVVHLSITNPSERSPLEYFRRKARLERALVESGLSHAILRPAVLFGGEDVLVNNIAWTLRRLPVFGLFGDGLYRLQPIHVEDLAELAVVQGRQRENAVLDAIGPETFTFRGLVEEIAAVLGKRRLIVRLPAGLAYAGCWILGKIKHDKMLTRDEVRGLMADLLCTNSPPTGKIRLTDWAREHADTLGIRYVSERARRSGPATPHAGG